MTHRRWPGLLALMGLLASLLFTTATASSAAAAEPKPEGYVLTTPTGGKTIAGSQAVKLNGRTLIAICYWFGIPSPEDDARPAVITTNLAPYTGVKLRAAGIMINHPDYADGKGDAAAAIKWAVLNRLRPDKVGDAYRAAWPHFARQLEQRDRRIVPTVERLLEELQRPLPAQTWLYNSSTQTPFQAGRQTLVAPGFSAQAELACPKECLAQGLVPASARNATRYEHRIRAIERGTNRTLGQLLVPAGKSASAVLLIPDNTHVALAVERFVGGVGWTGLEVFARFEVICPTPPPVRIITNTCCDKTVVHVEVVNTTRRPVSVGVRVGGWTRHTILQPGASLPRWAHQVTAPTVVRGEAAVVGAGGKTTGVLVRAESEVRPGRVTPVKASVRAA